jgi:hypothetical protein
MMREPPRYCLDCKEPFFGDPDSHQRTHHLNDDWKWIPTTYNNG